MVNDNDSTRSVNWVDYDMDGDADIFVTSEANQHERLYRNNGDETFTSITDNACLLYTSPSPRDRTRSRMPSSA